MSIMQRIGFCFKLFAMLLDLLLAVAAIATVGYAMYAYLIDDNPRWLLAGIGMIVARLSVDLLKYGVRKATAQKKRATSFFASWDFIRKYAPTVDQDFEKLPEEMRDQCVLHAELHNCVFITVKDFSKLHVVFASVGARIVGDDFVCTIYTYCTRSDGHSSGVSWELSAKGDRTIALYEGLRQIRPKLQSALNVCAYADDKVFDLVNSHINKRVKELLSPP